MLGNNDSRNVQNCLIFPKNIYNIIAYSQCLVDNIHNRNSMTTLILSRISKRVRRGALLGKTKSARWRLNNIKYKAYLFCIKYMELSFPLFRINWLCLLLMRLQKIRAPNYNQTGTNRADMRIAPYSTRTSIRQVVPKWVPKGSDYPSIETSRRLPELSITIKTSSNVIGTYIFWQCLTIPNKNKTKPDHQAIFLFITGKPQRDKTQTQ